MRRWLAIAVFLAAASAFGSQQDEAARANLLYQAGRRVDALPLYEDLAKIYPGEMLYQERLAGCLGAAAVQSTDPAQVQSLRTRERDAARQAVALGDKTNFVQELASLDPNGSLQIAPQSPGGGLLQDAEKAFDRGDFSDAMKGYTAAAAADPNLYEAPLYAGDTAYAQHDLAAAAHWFARAIHVDPNRETAYRYWGDAILRYGNDPLAAEQKFIDAIVAEPYSKYAWQGLQQWAEAEKAILLAPRIDRPGAPAIDPNTKDVTINVIPAGPDDAANEGGFAWMAYSMKRVLFRNDEFAKDFPDEKTYRHSLREEDQALKLVVSVLRERKIAPEHLDESLRNLLALSDAGMLDCWVLISGSDSGIAQDYAAYRDSHRQLLHDYIARFIVHGGTAAIGSNHP